MRKELDGEKIREIMDILSLIFSIADLKSEDLKKAASMYPLCINNPNQFCKCLST